MNKCTTLMLLTALLLAPLVALHAADAPKPAVKVTQELLNSMLLIRHGQDMTKATNSRKELTAFLTTDEGKTWSGKLLLDERTGVSYPDIAQAPNGDIYVHYDRDRTGAAEILFARFREEDVQAGKLVSKDAALKNLVKAGSLA